ncbi:MAG: hypothetical protein HY695_30660 [Deltaproteobacteria bacterium]|nr:hypothetical protein [Deltaproteobacteria bacterium]
MIELIASRDSYLHLMVALDEAIAQASAQQGPWTARLDEAFETAYSRMWQENGAFTVYEGSGELGGENSERFEAFWRGFMFGQFLLRKGVGFYQIASEDELV